MTQQLLEIQLNRPLQIKSYICQMDIAVQKPADLFFHIAKLADENGMVTEEILVNKFRFSVPMAKRALQRCKDFFKIFEQDPKNSNNYILTPDVGQALLAGGKLFFKENGKYRLIMTDDPIIPQRILSLQRIGRQSERTISITKQDLNVDNLVFQNLIVGTEKEDDGFVNSPEIRIEKCYEEVMIEKSEKSTLYVLCTLSPSRSNIKISGSFQYTTFRITPDTPRGKIMTMKREVKATVNNIPSTLNHKDVLHELLTSSNLAQDWHAEQSALRVPFDFNDKSNNYSEFFKRLSLNSPTISPFGAFNNMDILIPIMPKSEDDCLTWEKYLFSGVITHIIQPKQYSKLKNDIETQMSGKSGFSIPLPSQKDYAREILQQSEVATPGQTKEYNQRPNLYWFLQCPLDLTNQQNSTE